MTKIFIPLSRFHRELNSIARRLANGDVDEYHITINGRVSHVAMSPQRYKTLNSEIEELKELLTK